MDRNQYCPEEYAAFQERNQTLLEAEAQTDIDEDYFTAAEKMVGRIKIRPEWLPENPYFIEITSTEEQVKRAMAWYEGNRTTLEAVIEWLEQPCVEREHYRDNLIPMFPRQHSTCPECWQELRLSL